MRYKDLITALFIVATATWIWAEPSQEVRVPSRQQTMATQGWTIPDLKLSESTARIVESARPEPVKRPRIDPEDDPGIRLDTLSWTDYDSQEFQLAVSVNQGSDLRSTWFEVTFRGPRGFDLVKDGGNDAQFIVAFNDNGESLGTGNVQRVGANRWRFRGSDLKNHNPEEPVAWARLSKANKVQINTVLRDQKQSRFSRGANIMVLESDPIELSLR